MRTIKREVILQMLQESEGQPDLAIGKAERCEPDYEGMVERINKRIEKTAAFKDAALTGPDR